MDAAACARAAGLFAANRLRPGPFPGLPEDCRPTSETEGYAVQDAVHRALSARGHGALAGHKIGCTTPVMQRFLAIGQPCAGRIFAPTVHHGHGRFSHAGFHHVGVECEIAVRLDRTLAAPPFTVEAVAPAVGAVMAAIEVVDDRYADYRRLDAPTLIGDDFFNAGCVLGPPVAASRGLDLAALGGGMTINGQPVGRGTGSDILGHPLAALAWLAGLRAGQAQPLEAGSFVLLGSLVETRWVAAGDRVAIAIDALGEASADFT